MDVTFSEEYPYYTKPAIQGENIGNEYQLWNDIPTHSHSSSEPLVIPTNSLNQIPQISESESVSQTEPQSTSSNPIESSAPLLTGLSSKFPSQTAIFVSILGGEELKRKRGTEHVLSQSKSPTLLQAILTVPKVTSLNLLLLSCLLII